MYGHLSLSLYSLYTLFDLPLQYAGFLLAFRSSTLPSFWKFSPLSYSGMRLRGFCSPSAFVNGGSSPDCGSETSFLHFPSSISQTRREPQSYLSRRTGARTNLMMLQGVELVVCSDSCAAWKLNICLGFFGHPSRDVCFVDNRVLSASQTSRKWSGAASTMC